MTTDALLELHAAAAPFLRAGMALGRGRRERLRQALLTVVREGPDTLVPPELIASPSEALEQLKAVVTRCEELRVPWSEVVAVVNRENNEP